MNETYSELIRAIDYLKREVTQWQASQKISDEQAAQLMQTYAKWVEELSPNLDYSGAVPTREVCLEAQEPYANELQRLKFVQQELRRQTSHGRLTPSQSQSLASELAERIGKIERDFAAAANADATPEESSSAGRSFVEYLVDPRTLQMLMMTGGGFLVLGLVLWLWSSGVFENPKVLAYSLGAANLAVLAGGVSMVRFTRYETAGKGMTLLACLVLPLNLWLYSAQGLITIEGGGHLWVPAVICTAIYAGVARILRDSNFVYALVGGVTLTGMLFLADASISRFWEVLAPSTFLVVLGSVCVHVERLFKEGDSPFSRDKFGRAFFYAGHLVMLAGLFVLLGGRLFGWFYNPVFAELPWAWVEMPHVSSLASAKLWALGLAGLGTYTYIYSQLTVDPRGRRYAHSAVVTLLWSGVMLVDLIPITWTENVALLVLSCAGLAAFLLTGLSRTKVVVLDSLGKVMSGVGALCTTLATVWGGVALFRGLFLAETSQAFFNFDVFYALAMVAAAVACGIGTWARREQQQAMYGELYAYLLAVPLVGLLATGLVALGVPSLAMVLPVLALVPVVMELASLRDKQVEWLGKLSLTATASTVLLLTLSLGPVTEFSQTLASKDHLALSVFYLATAGTMALSAVRRGQTAPAVLSVVCVGAACWQLFTFAQLEDYAAILAAGATGLVTMAVAKWRASVSEKNSQTLSNVGLAVVVLGAAGGLFLTAGRLLVGEVGWQLVALGAGQALVALLASLLTQSKEWKQGMRVFAGFHVLSTVLVLNVLSGLTFWQRGELLTLVAGLLLLAAGHLRWRNEGESRDPLVDVQLLAGSLMAAAPLMWGLLAQRFGDYSPILGFALLHEVGALVVGLVLLGAGLVCRIRSTTLTGGAMLVTWLVSLVVMNLPELQNAAVLMMIGGGAFFTVAVLLSVYRDRLLSLPDRIRNREGMFSMLEWR